MSKVEDILEEKPHHTEKSVNLAPEHLQEYSNLIKHRAQFYREENAQMEEILKKLKLLTDELKLIGLGSAVKNFDKIFTELETKSCRETKTELGHAEKLRKHNHYLSKLKICIRHYINLNENIAKKIKNFKMEMECSKQDVNSVCPSDLQQLEEKAKKYESELIKFEKKYPWLKEPSDYNLPNIAKQISALKALKEEKDNLLKELRVYQNLKPDIKEAKQQLSELKEEMKSAMIIFKK